MPAKPAEPARGPADLEPSYGGHSIARRDGDTSVADTIGYNGRGVLNGEVVYSSPHMTQRMTKSDDGLTLHIETTLEDPAIFPAPVTDKP